MFWKWRKVSVEKVRLNAEQSEPVTTTVFTVIIGDIASVKRTGHSRIAFAHKMHQRQKIWYNHHKIFRLGILWFRYPASALSIFSTDSVLSLLTQWNLHLGNSISYRQELSTRQTTGCTGPSCLSLTMIRVQLRTCPNWRKSHRH